MIAKYAGGEVDSEDTAGVMFAAYAMKALPPQSPQDQALAKAVSNSFKQHVEREIDNALEYDFRLGRDLMQINDTEEEGLLFEIPDKSKVEADSKEAVIKGWIEAEKAIIREIAQ